MIDELARSSRGPGGRADRLRAAYALQPLGLLSMAFDSGTCDGLLPLPLWRVLNREFTQGVRGTGAWQGQRTCMAFIQRISKRSIPQQVSRQLDLLPTDAVVPRAGAGLRAEELLPSVVLTTAT